MTELLGGGRREGYIFRHRGVTYADGVVYSAAGSFIFALDAHPATRLRGQSWPSKSTTSMMSARKLEGSAS